MAEFAVKVLDTTVADTGPTQTAELSFLKEDKPVRFHADIGSGDTVLIEGKSDSDDDWDTLATFTDETPQDVFISKFWRARRSVDGATADSAIRAANPFNQNFTAHTS